MGFSVLVDGMPVRLIGKLPLLPLRDVILFPGMSLPLFVGRPASVAAVMKAAAANQILFATAQRRPDVTVPRRTDLYEIGVVVLLRQVLSLPDGTMRVLVEGLLRARLQKLHGKEDLLEAEIVPYAEVAIRSAALPLLLREVKSLFLDYAAVDRRIPEDVLLAISSCEGPEEASHQMSGHLLVRLAARQELLEAPGPTERLHLISRLVEAETEMARSGRKIELRHTGGRPRGAGDGALELPGRRERRRDWDAEGDDAERELAELETAVGKARMSIAAEEKVRRELDRLGRMAALSPEATVARTYIDWLLAVPWHKRTRDRTNLEAAARILDRDHHGLVPVKERILEQIAVMRFSRGVRGPVLCLVGPPGVGKTSLGSSVARALNRNFVRMSLGGVRDEAEIRGHRRTYIGSMPGRIVQAMRRAGSVNPVILLDEVDKLGVDYRGDPAAALLEVLDPEQNHAFNDHYLEVDYDLSRVLFLTTANSMDGIPPALRDRMEVIRLPGYLENEKLAIAEKYLLPRQREACGLKPAELTVDHAALLRVIREYTREAGVRNLERETARICRRTARRKAGADFSGTVTIGADEVEPLLGVPRFLPEAVERRDRVGLATGLAWSEAGGSVLQIEVGILPGRGKLILTGKLGATMRESAQAALSCIRCRAARLGLDPQFHRGVDIHVHIPEGEIPKDGPSAGAAIGLAMVSALTRVPTKDSVALTGEMTLRGQILPVGGLAEKSLAALRAGVRTVLVPGGNDRHVAELPEEARAGLEFVRVSSFDEVLRHGLVRRRASPSVEARPSRQARSVAFSAPGESPTGFRSGEAEVPAVVRSSARSSLRRRNGMKEAA
jgi:ATP-dependent Lon protease